MIEGESKYSLILETALFLPAIQEVLPNGFPRTQSLIEILPYPTRRLLLQFCQSRNFEPTTDVFKQVIVIDFFKRCKNILNGICEPCKGARG